MKKNFNKILLLSFLFFGHVAANAQSITASYTYDANGNRTGAQVIYLIKSAQLIQSPNAFQQDIIPDSIPDCSVQVYPNPTHGDLFVEIKGISDLRSSIGGNTLKVLNMLGKQVLEVPVRAYDSPIDLSGITPGIYIVRVDINGKIKSFNIIKK